MTSFQLFQKQQKFLADLQKKRPDLLKAENVFSENTVLPQIGITTLNPKKPLGFIRLYPQDFIVEEIQKDRSLSLIEPEDAPSPPPATPKFTLFADLVKVGISTLEAINRLSSALEIEPNKIGYAGIKDAQALTSQRIGLPRIEYEKIKDLKLEGLFLTRFFYNKGTIQKGNLWGNRFTILVRTKERLSRTTLKEKLSDLKDNGFLNYYHTQRFGGLRLLSHTLGKLILQEKYEETIKIFLGNPSDYSIKLIRGLRQRASEQYGKWQKMKKIFEVLPYTFRNEIRILDYLEKHPKNFIGALKNIQDQTQLWVYAYASLVFNQYLSWAVQNNIELPAKLPLLLSQDSRDRRLYEALLYEDKIKNIRDALKPFKFIQLKKRLNPTRIYPENILAKSLPEGAIISFCLPKGAYATTFLANLFKLQQGLPLPDWLKSEEMDIKEILEIGTIQATKERLKDYIFSVLDYEKESNE